MINENRLVNEFIELCKINSESKFEGKISTIIKEKLREIGGKVYEDNAKEAIGSEVGNIIAKFSGKSDLPTVLLCAHLDTVKVGDENINVVIDGDIIKSDGKTILGADDKSGIAIILEVIRSVSENDRPPIDVVFTVCEEIGLLGSKNLAYLLIDAKYGYVLDTGDVDKIVTSAPSHNRFFIKIYGVEAHAGAEPEKGISAIELAGKAIAKLNLGRIDEETTANIGRISGGVATNIVAGYTELEGEVRSHNEEKLEKMTKEIIDKFDETVKASKKIIDGKEISAKMESKVTREYKRFAIPSDESIVQKVISSGKELGIDMKCIKGGGGSDANIFNEKGIKTILIGTGMQKVHTKDEFIKISDLVLSAKLLEKIIKV